MVLSGKLRDQWASLKSYGVGFSLRERVISSKEHGILKAS